MNLTTAIPDGRIVDTPEFRLLDDLPTVFAVNAQSAAYDYMVADLPLVESAAVEARIAIGDMPFICAVNTLDLGGKTLVLSFREDDYRHYLFFRMFMIDRPWNVCTKMLLLPADSPAEWGEDDDASDQQVGRVLYFLALATLNNWFRPLE